MLNLEGVKEFCQRDFERSYLRELKKDHLLVVANAFEVEIEPQVRRLDIVGIVEALQLPNPLKEQVRGKLNNGRMNFKLT